MCVCVCVCVRRACVCVCVCMVPPYEFIIVHVFLRKIVRLFKTHRVHACNSYWPYDTGPYQTLCATRSP